MKRLHTTNRAAFTFGALLAVTGLWAAVPAAAQTALERAAGTGTHAAGPNRLSFDDAMADYERCHWPQAFAQLAALADAEHPHAARIALLMAKHGPALYGTRFDVGAAQRGRWLLAAVKTPWALARGDTD